MQKLILSRWLIFMSLALSGCIGQSDIPGRPDPGPTRAYQGLEWQNAIVFEGTSYRIKTNTSAEEARRIHTFMVKALAVYKQVTDIQPSRLPMLDINVYAAQADYEAAVDKIGLPRISTGFYSPEQPAAVHLPWLVRDGEHPLYTLIHEGFHQFAHQAVLADKDLNPQPGDPSFPVQLPLWLNEGIAQLLEATVVSKDKLGVVCRDPVRFAKLNEIWSTADMLNLEKVLSAPYGGTFDEKDYLMAWGVTFALYRGWNGQNEFTQENLLPPLIRKIRQRLATQAGTAGSRQWIFALASTTMPSLRAMLQERGWPLTPWLESLPQAFADGRLQTTKAKE